MLVPSNRLARRASTDRNVIAAAVAAGVVLTIVAMVTSPLVAIGGVLAILTAERFWQTPIPAVLLILVFYSTIFEVDVLPLVPVGIGSLNPLDIGLALCLIRIAMRRWREPDFSFYIGLPEFAIIVFIVALALSTLMGLSNGLTNIDDATNEIRYSGYYLMILIVGALLTSFRDVDRLINSFLVLAVIVALSMVAQAVLGDAVTIVNGRVEPISQDTDAAATTRVIPGGRYLILVSFWSFNTLIGITDDHPVLYRLGWLATGTGVLLTFNRNFWVATVVVLILIAVAVGAQARRRYLTGIASTFAAALVVAALVLVGPQSEVRTALVDFGDRTLSIFDSETYDRATTTGNRSLSSLEFRRAENRYAAEHLSPPSPLGLGAGAPYRPLDSRLDWEAFVDGPAYIHNAHLWVLMKAGYIGYGALMVGFLSCIARGLNLHRRLENPKHQAICVTFSIALVGVLLTSIVDPALTDATWAPIFGVIAGVNAALLRLHQRRIDRGASRTVGLDAQRLPVGAR